jgi:hypothetical protein
MSSVSAVPIYCCDCGFPIHGTVIYTGNYVKGYDTWHPDCIDKKNVFTVEQVLEIRKLIVKAMGEGE